jgi:hypothetical protein
LHKTNLVISQTSYNSENLQVNRWLSAALQTAAFLLPVLPLLSSEAKTEEQVA